MEGELDKFIKVWLSIIVSQIYCYVIGKSVSKGLKRLVLYIPIVCLFLVVPLKLSSVNLCGGTAFFISLLGTLKLLLFSFGKGPLSLDPQISLSKFILISCFPIEIRQYPNGQKWPKHFPIKILVFAILCPLIDNKEKFHPKVNLVILCLSLYLVLEIILGVTAAVVRALLGVELEPHFNEPYLATSLQDFWGKRWNLLTSHVLHSAIYKPILKLCAHVIGRKWAPIPGVVGTFVFSGLYHELIYFYLCRVTPTWEVTWFFTLQGFCLALEIIVKKSSIVTWRIPSAISWPLTVIFLISSGSWLFFPQFLRCNADVRMFQEYANFGIALKHKMYKVIN